MKKTLLILLATLSIALLLMAQAPQKLSYQGILRNPDGTLRVNEQVTIILQFLCNDEVVYSESHHVITGTAGHFAIYPGTGSPLLGDFSYIDWSQTPVVVRTILDGSVLAQSELTSVPYALFAAHVEGEEETAARIESLELTHNRQLQRIDSLCITVEQWSRVVDTIHMELDSAFIAIDSLSVTSDTLAAGLDSLALQILSLQATDTLLQHSIHSATAAIDSLARRADFYNVTARHPLPAGSYYTAASAREATPLALRKPGMVLTFRSDTLTWSSLRFAATDTALWNDPARWVEFGQYGNITLPYRGTTALTRLQVPLESRKQGLIVSYFADSVMVNEQYMATATTDSAWVADSLWISLLDTRHLARIDSALHTIDSAIARLDSVNNALSTGIERLSNSEAWYYTSRNDLFTSAGYVNTGGTEVVSPHFVHTTLIPISQRWVITGMAGNSCAPVLFFSGNDYTTHIACDYDTLATASEQVVTIDLAKDTIPAGAAYFCVNMPVVQQQSVSLQYRAPASLLADEPTPYYYETMGNPFVYLGACIDVNGARRASSISRHTRFLPIEDAQYKITSYGMLSQDDIVPVVVYFSNANYGDAIGYDIGQVGSNGATSRSFIVNAHTAPEGAHYFVVNLVSSVGIGRVYTGEPVETAIASSESRISALETNRSCYTDKKLVTLGDSFTTNSGNNSTRWQALLAGWLGLVWSSTETMTGINGYSPMGYGGAWVLPNDKYALSIRDLDVHRYAPDLIIVYGGQNDKIDTCNWGSIDDEPFIPAQFIDYSKQSNITTLQQAIDFSAAATASHIDKTVINVPETYGDKLYYIEDASRWTDTTAWIVPCDSVTFYAAYKGVVQHLCSSCPQAAIYCMTLLQCNYAAYDGSLGDLAQLDSLRRMKCDAIHEIAAYYGVQLIDLWNMGGINSYNVSNYYDDWLHPNAKGYRRLAESIYRVLR